MNSILRKISYNRLSSFFSKANELCLPYALIKGEPLSLYAYGTVEERAPTDFDILTSNVQLCKRILNENGFTQKQSNYFSEREQYVFCIANSHQLIPFSDKTENILVDLNFDIFWGEYEGPRINMSEFLSDTIDIEIYGVHAKTLSPMKSLIQLILHHFKDLNSIFLLATRNCIRIDMFKDVYYLLKNNLVEISPEKLFLTCSKYQIVPFVYYVLYYTNLLFNDSVLTKYIELLKTSQGQRLLGIYGLCEKEYKEWKVDFKTRLNATNLLPFIESDLCEADWKKIKINKQIFMGEVQ